jgi:hypothetical protein
MSSPSPSPSTSPGLIAAIAGAAVLALVVVGTFLWSVVAEVTALTAPPDAGPLRVPPAPLPTARSDVAPALPPPPTPTFDASVGVDVVAFRAPPAVDAATAVDAPATDTPEDDPAFRAMSDREHLAAARVAMAEDYDRESRTGGDLDLARRHLHAIPPESRAHGRADALLREIEGREARFNAILALSAANGERARAAQAARGEAPLQLGNGSYYEINHYMRETLDNPASYEPVACSTPVPRGPYWSIACSFRALDDRGRMGWFLWTYFVQNGAVVQATPERRLR